MYASPVVQPGCISNPPLTRHADKGLQRMSVDDLKLISLGRTLREGVSAVIESLILSSYCGFGNLYFVSLTIRLCVFCAYVSLSSVRFLWKIPTCFAELRETMFFVQSWATKQGTTLLCQGGGKNGMGWRQHGENDEYQSERSLRGSLTCSHALLGPLLFCVWWQEGKKGMKANGLLLT